MKKSFFTLLLFPIIIVAYIINPESNLEDSINISYSSPVNYDIVFDYSNYIILINSDLDISQIKFYCLLNGYNTEELNISVNDTLTIKQSIDSIINNRGIPAYIILVGNIDKIPSYMEYINPYSKLQFPADNYYGAFDNTIIPISRIPVKNNFELENYSNRVIKYMISDCVNTLNIIAPFYDNDNNSYEDISYCSKSFYIGEFLNSIFDIKNMFETNSDNPLYFYDNSPLPDYLLKPVYDWSLHIDSINSLPNICLYRGHGNIYETVFPQISISEISNYNFDNSIFTLFTCLTGNFNAQCIAESLINCEHGAISVISASSETFFQYNNIMTELFFDFMNNDIYANINSSDEKEIGNIFQISKQNFLTIAGNNAYSQSQYNSYNLFGLPFIRIKKSYTTCPFSILKDTLIYGVNNLEINILNDCKITINDKSEIYDTMQLPIGEHSIKLDNIRYETMYYISCIDSGILFIDSFYIKKNSLMISDFIINDKIGDFDNIAEFGETLFVNYLVYCNEDHEIKIHSNDFFIFDTLSSVSSDTTIKCSTKICVNKDIDIGSIEFSTDSYNYIFTLPIERRKVQCDTMFSPDSPFIYSNNTYNLEFEFSLINHQFDSIDIEFLPNNDYSFENYNYTIKDINNSNFLVFNRGIFHKDSLIIPIIFKSRFLIDTLFINFKLNKDILFFYDPLNIYYNSQLLNFIDDSLQIKYIYSNVLDTSIFYEHNIFIFGTYPNNISLNKIHSDYIYKLNQKNAFIYTEGSDIMGYDTYGKDLWSIFGINIAEDGINLYENTLVYNSFLEESLKIDTLIKSADIYSCYYSPLELYNNNYSSIYENNICQSIPLKQLNGEDNSYMYFLYIDYIMNFNEQIEYNNLLDLNISNSLNIKNISENSLLIKFIKIPSFIENIEYDSRIILQGDTKNFIIHTKPNLFGTYNGEIVFSIGFSTYRVNVKYKTISPLFKILSIQKNKIVIETNHSIELIDKTDDIFIKKKKNEIIIYGNFEFCHKNYLKLKINNNIYKIPIIQFLKTPKKYKFNILGAKINKLNNGIYYNNKEKYLILGGRAIHK